MVILGFVGLGALLFAVVSLNSLSSHAGKRQQEISPKSSYQYSTNLADVAGGQASGHVEVKYDGTDYTLEAVFYNLPDPLEDEYYEGWVVRKKPLSVISTGHASKIGDNYTYTFETNRNLTDHTEYVLTLESNDGDPSLGESLFEGTLILR
ncbi:hypothetical protein A2801_00510 [Candidatus Woesebacteria bacterium RIFCSPHIGHO2_01_FULL_41_10]|uniref:Anti-sigma factor n=1 Tax=Candidatus Woesebacteria bacterium RIFCSPHIGHO2_01_FULL_41_10 TaxID=1802500 RepID=A0A1F7YRP0_9BACT|nr:MAG: hypothetical protein A2801_00510 [Candidatus Woesebacteria bacterium RIFCSPHIGHO2_01_FULL_41_10]